MHGDRGKWEGWALKPQVNHNGWMTVVAPADRPKSVRNSCVIECICSAFVSFYLCIICRLGVFVIRLRQNSSIFSFWYRDFCHITKEQNREVLRVSKVKSREKTRQVRENWFQQLENKQSQKAGRNQVSGRVSVPFSHATTKGVTQGRRGRGACASPLSNVGGHKWVCAPPPPHFWAEQMF